MRYVMKCVKVFRHPEGDYLAVFSSNAIDDGKLPITITCQSSVKIVEERDLFVIEIPGSSKAEQIHDLGNPVG